MTELYYFLKEPALRKEAEDYADYLLKEAGIMETGIKLLPKIGKATVKFVGGIIKHPSASKLFDLGFLATLPMSMKHETKDIFSNFGKGIGILSGTNYGMGGAI